jgi:NAD(P)-dependent dehydrogenase (short-subunit alcohol dehydrogenase family)
VLLTALPLLRELDRGLVLPVRCGGVPADVANAAPFLAAEGSGYLTGQVIYLDGGGV